jgi:hypothetical protein
MWWYLVEHSPSILHAPTFYIHVNQASAHKDIWISFTLNDLDLQWHQTFPAMPSTCCPSLFKKPMGPAHQHALSQLQQYRPKQEFSKHAPNHHLDILADSLLPLKQIMIIQSGLGFTRLHPIGLLKLFQFKKITWTHIEF